MVAAIALGKAPSLRQRWVDALFTGPDFSSRRKFRIILGSVVIFCTLALTLTLLRPASSSSEVGLFTSYIPGSPDQHEKIKHPPLKPFPHSPLTVPDGGDEPERKQNPWLAAVISPAFDVERRMLIRSTWMHMYRDLPFDGRFVLANPGPLMMETVSLENRTYGDLIVLDHINEDPITANTVKTLEFYKWLVQSGLKYEFVTKLDTDLWLNARGFWETYLEPRLSSPSSSKHASSPRKATVSMTTIAQIYYSRPSRRVFPHGSMYTNTWDLVELISRLQEADPVYASEDRANTLLLQRANKKVNFVHMNGAEKFDFDPEDTRAKDSPWARKDTHPNAQRHALHGTDVIAVHKLKDLEAFLRVAVEFDSQGIKPMPELDGEERAPSLYMRLHDALYTFGWTTRFESYLDRLPDSMCPRQGKDWVCDGVWNMGPNKTGF